MQLEKDYLKEKGILPRISFKKTPIVTGLKLLERRKLEITNVEGEKVQGLEYIVEHEGIKKSFFTTSIDLINQLLPTENNEIVNITLKSVKSPTGQFKSKYLVKYSSGNEAVVKNEQPVEKDSTEEDINVEDIPF